MALLGVVAALLLVTAWFCLWALLIAVAVSLGAPLWLVLLVALALSLVAAWLLLRMVRAEARHLLFPASVRQLRAGLEPSTGAAAAHAAAATAGAAE
jgi:membrane protein implicated in regulation of membrane protease activity